MPVQYTEQRANGLVVHLEEPDNRVRVLPAWKLNPVCARLRLGSPTVSVAALHVVSTLLVSMGWRRSSLQDVLSEEENDGDAQEKAARAPGAIAAVKPDALSATM